jgi:serine/threonine protein kinase
LIGHYDEPEHFSADLIHFLSQLLQLNPKQRLTSTQMKEHRWFSSINWSDIVARKTIAPYIPAMDQTHFEKCEEMPLPVNETISYDEEFADF